MHILAVSLISLLSVLIYSNTFHAEFQFDDRPNIVNNAKAHLYALSMQGLKKVFSESRPVARLSIALNYHYGHLNVFGYHVVNIFLHVATAVAFYFLILATLRLPTLVARYGRVPDRVALIGSLLWAVHPVQTQAVDLVVQRMTLMMALFSLLALLCYVGARRSTGARRIALYGLSLLLILLGLGSKENAAIVPFLILLYEIYFISNFRWNTIRRILFLFAVYFLIVLLFIGFVSLKLQPGDWEAMMGVFTAKYIQGPYTLSFGERFITECRIMIYYLSLLALPHPDRLILDYDFPISYSIFDPVSTLPSLLFVIGSILFAFFMARKFPLVSFCILWFYGSLAIESVFLKLDLLYEHRLYLPSMAIMVLVAAGIEKMWLIAESDLSWLWRKGLAGAGVVMVLLLCLWTYERNAVWRTAETLWEDNVKKTPGNARVHHSLSVAYSHQGKFEMALKESQEALRLRPTYTEARVNLAYLHQMRGDLDLAVEEYQAALKSEPKWYLALNNLGAIYYNKRQLPEAIELFQRAIAANPMGGGAHFALGIAYSANNQIDLAIRELEETLRLNPFHRSAYASLVELYKDQGQLQKAIEIYERAAALDTQLRQSPDRMEVTLRRAGQRPQAAVQDKPFAQSDSSSPQIEYELALSFHQEGRWAEAIQRYRESVRLDPSAAFVHYQLGLALYQNRQTAEAIKAYRAAADRDSRIKGLYFNLGLALQQTGQIEQARDAYEEAIRLEPGHDKAHFNLAWIYQRLENPGRAIEHYRLSLDLNSANEEAHNNLGVLYAGQGQLEEAIQEFRMAIINRPEYIQSRYNLARALQLMGNKQEAMAEYEKLVAIRSADGERNPYQEQAQVELRMLKAMK